MTKNTTVSIKKEYNMPAIVCGACGTTNYGSTCSKCNYEFKSYTPDLTYNKTAKNDKGTCQLCDRPGVTSDSMKAGSWYCRYHYHTVVLGNKSYNESIANSRPVDGTLEYYKDFHAKKEIISRIKANISRKDKEILDKRLKDTGRNLCKNFTQKELLALERWVTGKVSS